MRVLIVEDERDLAAALAHALREEGFVCDVADEGHTAVHMAQECEYDALVLDLMLPGLDGHTVLKRVRAQRRTPVLVLTARDTVADKIGLLNAGADDYLTKPFVLNELIARVRALIRRAAGDPRPTIDIGRLSIDTVARVVRRSGQVMALSPKEYALVEFLARHRGQLVTRSQLYEHLYDEREDTLSNVIDVYVFNVRKRLGHDFVRTRRGEGYVVDG